MSSLVISFILCTLSDYRRLKVCGINDIEYLDQDLEWSLTINKVQVFLVCIVMYNPVSLWLSRAKVEVLTFPPFLIVIVN